MARSHGDRVSSLQSQSQEGTWLGCALGQQACRDGLTALSLRLPRFLQELPMAKGDGRYGKLLTTLAKTDVLILDDWGLAPFSEENRRDLLEIVEDRHDRRATIITSQLPVEHWHDALGDPTLADAILDRLVQATFPWSTWQRSRGLGGRHPADWVAAFTWTEWQPSDGLGGRNPWNTHPLT